MDNKDALLIAAVASVTGETSDEIEAFLNAPLGASPKKPKETEAVKKKLESYATLQRSIDNKNQRLKTLKASIGSTSSQNLTGMPGGGGNRESEEERYLVRVDDLERSIERLKQQERELLDELEGLIEQLESPDEQTVIEMRYIDRLRWWPICAALYSGEPDYEEKADKYLKRTFKVHGSALQALAKVYRVEDTINLD